MTDTIASGLRATTSTLTTLAAVALRSRRPAPRPSEAPRKPLLIMGNGPSLNETLTTQRDAMHGYELMAVNFAANSDIFTELCPGHYVLADPHFFGSDTDINVSKLWTSLDAATWPVTLHLPAGMQSHPKVKKWAENALKRVIRPFNMTAAEGVPAICRFLIDRGLAMPRPRNVLIPSIMSAIRLGYRRIVIAGADHTWTKTLSVDDKNRVVTIQPHFYADNKEEKERVTSVYQNIRLHEVLGSMAVAFKSYHVIADYARQRGIEILNASPGSFIDAFPRVKSL